MKLKAILAIVAIIIATANTTANAGRYEFLVKDGEVVLSDLENNAYVIKLNLPSSIQDKRIDLATIEFFIDAMKASAVEAYELKFASVVGFTEGDTTFTTGPGDWPHHVGIAPNSSERVIMDITPVVKACLEDMGPYYGVLYKSAGDESIQPNLKSGVLDPNTVGKLKIYFSNR